MKSSERPIWRKSILQGLDLGTIKSQLAEMAENGDVFGYDSDESGYYQEFKELFDEISEGAWNLLEAMEERSDLDVSWDDATVGLMGETTSVLGYDNTEMDYWKMESIFEDTAQKAAADRLMRLSKRDLIDLFHKVLVTLASYVDLKAAHDCLTAIVEELDYRAAIMEGAVRKIDQLYEDLTGQANKDLDFGSLNLPGRMWVE